MIITSAHLDRIFWDRYNGQLFQTLRLCCDLCSLNNYCDLLIITKYPKTKSYRYCIARRWSSSNNVLKNKKDYHYNNFYQWCWSIWSMIQRMRKRKRICNWHWLISLKKSILMVTKLWNGNNSAIILFNLAWFGMIEVLRIKNVIKSYFSSQKILKRKNIKLAWHLKCLLLWKTEKCLFGWKGIFQI